MLGSIFAAAGSKATDSAFSIGEGMIASAEQYRRNKKTALNAPSWQVQGLRKAGINPILAAQIGGAPSTGLANMSSGGSVAGAAQSSSAASINRKMLDNVKLQNTKLESEIHKTRAEADAASSAANIARNHSAIDGLVTDAYIKNRALLPLLQAYNRAGVSSAVNAATSLLKPFKK